MIVFVGCFLILVIIVGLVVLGLMFFVIFFKFDSWFIIGLVVFLDGMLVWFVDEVIKKLDEVFCEVDVD